MLNEAILDPSDLLEQFQQLSILKGTIGVIALLIFLSIRLYRLPQWQEQLPLNARWENLPVLARYGIIAALAGLGGGLSSVSQGLTWQQSLAAAAAAVITAITANKVTKTEPVRAMVHLVVPPKEQVRFK
jgi:hypothetical protein